MSSFTSEISTGAIIRLEHCSETDQYSIIIKHKFMSSSYPLCFKCYGAKSAAGEREQRVRREIKVCTDRVETNKLLTQQRERAKQFWHCSSKDKASWKEKSTFKVKLEQRWERRVSKRDGLRSSSMNY